MSLASFSCYAWWFVLGSLAGWLALWLVDRLFLRDGTSAERLRSAEAKLAGALDQQTRQQSDIAALRSELSTAQKAAAEVPQLRQRVADHEGREKSYQGELQRLTGELDGRSGSLRADAAEIDGLKTEVARLAAASAGLTAALGMARNSASSTQGDLDAAHGLLTRMRSAGESLQAELVASREELARAKGEREIQVTRVGELERDLDAARQGVIEARRAGGNLDATQEEAQAREIASLQSELETARTTAGGLTLEVERLKAASAADVGRVTQLSNELETLRLAHQRYGEELGETRRALTEAEARGAKATYDGGALVQQKETEVAALKASLADATGRADRLDSEVARLMSELSGQSTLAGELARLKAEAADRSSALAGAAASLSEVEALRARVASLTSQLGQFETLKSAMEAAQKAAAGHAADIARLNAELLGSIPGTGASDPAGSKS